MMITVAIIGILATIAYPSFIGSVRKGRRVDATDLAAGVMQAQERWRANNPQYTASLSSLKVSSTTANGYYTVAVSDTSSTAYTVSFTPVAGKGQDKDTKCTAMKVTVTKGQPVYDPVICWSR